MPLTLQNPELERLAKDVAERTGEPLEQAVLSALQEKLERLSPLAERLAMAASALQKDYEQDKELTAFSALDGEPLYDMR